MFSGPVWDSPRGNRYHLIESFPPGSDPAQVPLNQPQQVNSPGDDDRFCLFRISATVRGRMQGSVPLVTAPTGAIPDRSAGKR